MVVVVACTPLVGWSSWWALPVLPVDWLFLVGFALVTNEPGVHCQRFTTLACGQGCDAVIVGCLIPKTFEGLIEGLIVVLFSKESCDLSDTLTLSTSVVFFCFQLHDAPSSFQILLLRCHLLILFCLL